MYKLIFFIVYNKDISTLTVRLEHNLCYHLVFNKKMILCVNDYNNYSPFFFFFFYNKKKQKQILENFIEKIK